MLKITAREQEILQATMDLVAERGLLGTTISQIAKRAKASPGIIYHYFESKDEIVHKLYAHLINSFGDALLANVESEQPWEDWLIQVWLNSYHYFVGHPKQAVFMEQYKNSAYHGRVDDPMYANTGFQTLIDVIERELQNGTIKPLPLPVMYQLTIGTAIGLAKLHIEGEATLGEQMLQDIAQSTIKTLKIAND